MKILRARLYDLELKKRAEEQAEREGEKKDIGWGSQIRSYVLQPYRMVKDQRTGDRGRRRRPRPRRRHRSVHRGVPARADGRRADEGGGEGLGRDPS